MRWKKGVSSSGHTDSYFMQSECDRYKVAKFQIGGVWKYEPWLCKNVSPTKQAESLGKIDGYSNFTEAASACESDSAKRFPQEDEARASDDAVPAGENSSA